MGNQVYRGHERGFIIFTIVSNIVIGFFSVISDNLSFLADGITAFEFIISYLAVMLNSLPMWFIFAMVVGYKFSKDIKNAILLGGIYSITAITFYFVIGFIYEDEVAPIPFKEHVISYAKWYGASAVGGFFGGSVGFLMKKNPYVLLLLFIGLVIQLFVNGPNSWDDIVGIAQNLTFCLMLVSIILYLAFAKSKMHNRKDYEISSNT